MAYQSETLEPIVVTDAKELPTPTFFEKDIDKIARKAINSPKEVASGVIIYDVESNFVGARAYFEVEDGLYIFTCGNSYALVPITKAGLQAQLPLRVAMPVVNPENGAGVIGVLGVTAMQDDDGNVIGASFFPITSNEVVFDPDWGWKLLKI